MIKNLKIMDWLVHGGHQYEFFKTGPQFYCSKLNGEPPKEGDFGRPIFSSISTNVLVNREIILSRNKYDLIMVRAGLNPKRYNRFRKISRVPGIATIQTVGRHPDPNFPLPNWVKCVVWNSKVCMDNNYKNLPGKHHFYIPHGFDPVEFKKKDLKKNGRVLTVASVFRKRGSKLGFSDWKHVSDSLNNCDLVGHGDEDLSESIGTFPMPKLCNIYNRYSVFLNTTTKSAMPRSRGEALMCGMATVTTNNYGINRYLRDGYDCLFADNKEDMIKKIKLLLDNKNLSLEIGNNARNSAKKYFNISTYISRWEEVFTKALS